MDRFEEKNREEGQIPSSEPAGSVPATETDAVLEPAQPLMQEDAIPAPEASAPQTWEGAPADPAAQEIPTPAQLPTDGEPVAPEAATYAPVQEQPILDWTYGAAKKPAKDKNKKGMGSFFAVFGGVFAACVLLLALTFWLGDVGFNITQTVNHERVVYVREDGTVVGKYTPGEVVDQLMDSTVTVVVKGASVSGFGSGFIYSADGYVITNHHVIDVDGTADVQVMLASGKVYDATVVGSNKAADVAVLKINADVPLKPVTIGNSELALVGEDVVAIGTAVELDYQGTATFGRISASSRIVTFSDSNGNITKRMYVMQTDTSVNPGNSGGPLVNMDGEVVGVVVMKLMGNSQTYYEGMGFALPINGVVEIADAIIENGSFTGVNPIAKGRLLLGVTGHSVVEGYWYNVKEDSIDISMSPVDGYVQMPISGVHVISASAGSGAAGKVQRGDIIIKADGLRVTTIEDLIGAVNRRESGYGVTLTVLRDGRTVDVVVNLSEEPLQ